MNSVKDPRGRKVKVDAGHNYSLDHETSFGQREKSVCCRMRFLTLQPCLSLEKTC